MNVISMNQYKYQKYAKAVGSIDMSYDIQNNKINDNFTRRYIKAYITLLTK